MAVWSTEAVTEFIRLFRKNPCLWKVKCKDYGNRHIRNVAYDELVDYCKKIGFSSANREFVTKKIQNLRGSFRKEIKKVTEAQNSGGSIVYKTNLWYYDLLYFTKGQEDDNKEEENEPPDQPAKFLQQPTRIASPPSLADISSPEESNESIQSRKVLKRKAVVTDTQIKLMKVCTEALKRKEITEFEGFAISVAKKLEKMNSIQALYAESLIHSVLRKGLLNRLTEETDICDKLCNKNVSFSPRLTPSTSSDLPEAAYQVIQNEDTEPLHEDPLSTNIYDESFVKVEHFEHD
ncbi:uncharacterized protein LOC134747811 [Cydia strobilella]|uniref:uncharacterized protein LOC134747811 n=1 Tax=Cydia strobilella TaxID=1100964 RepID=UPI003003D3A6